MTACWSCLPPCLPTAVESQIEVPRFLFELVPWLILFDARLDIGPSCTRLHARSLACGSFRLQNWKVMGLIREANSGLIPVSDKDHAEEP